MITITVPDILRTTRIRMSITATVMQTIMRMALMATTITVMDRTARNASFWR